MLNMLKVNFVIAFVIAFVIVGCGGSNGGGNVSLSDKLVRTNYEFVGQRWHDDGSFTTIEVVNLRFSPSSSHTATRGGDLPPAYPRYDATADYEVRRYDSVNDLEGVLLGSGSLAGTGDGDDPRYDVSLLPTGRGGPSSGLHFSFFLLQGSKKLEVATWTWSNMGDNPNRQDYLGFMIREGEGKSRGTTDNKWWRERTQQPHP